MQVNIISQRYELIEVATQKSSQKLSVSELCKLINVSRSGYYNWTNTKEQREQREKKDEADFLLVLEAFQYRGFDKGSRAIHMRLLRQGVRMNRKKIQRLMQKYNLVCSIRKERTHKKIMKALQTSKVADNHLKREFKKYGARKVLLTDITYIPYRSGFCYLSVIKDAYTNEILSYVLSQSLEVDFVLNTITQLFDTHGFTIDDEVMIHSDQGSHYTSIKFQALIKDYGMRQSMSRKGNCWDNAPQESFFGHMKSELRKKKKAWNTYEDIQADIDDWIDYYNNERGQWGLNKLAPSEYYTYVTTGELPEFIAA